MTLAVEMFELAGAELRRAGGKEVHAIHLEVGKLCGVDRDAFLFACTVAARNSGFEQTEISITEQEGRGWCPVCNESFIMEEILGLCTRCQAPPARLVGGQDFRIVSLNIS